VDIAHSAKASAERGDDAWHVIHIGVNPATHAVYALTEGAGLFQSLDHASNWAVLDTHLGLKFRIGR
jgi:hypothetical protein